MAEQVDPAAKFFPPIDELQKAAMLQAIKQITELIEAYHKELSPRALPPETVERLVLEFAAAIWGRAVKGQDG